MRVSPVQATTTSLAFSPVCPSPWHGLDLIKELEHEQWVVHKYSSRHPGPKTSLASSLSDLFVCLSLFELVTPRLKEMVMWRIIMAPTADKSEENKLILELGEIRAYLSRSSLLTHISSTQAFELFATAGFVSHSTYTEFLAGAA